MVAPPCELDSVPGGLENSLMARHVDTGSWAGKCVIVTGASSGIGREVAGQVGAMGADVGLIARNESRLAETCSRI